MNPRDTAFLPWQTDAARAWLSHRERFAHAWVLLGEAGLGQTTFLDAAAASLLCEAPEAGLACGHCESCRWVREGNHPDVRRIRPDATAVEEGESVADGGRKQPSRDIRIDQVRSLLPWFNLAPHRGGVRVALLYPAEALNVVAANALLKILEEPPAHTIFLLTARHVQALLPTLSSRCRRLVLPRPAAEVATQWLQAQDVDAAAARLAATGGAPLLARAQAQAGQAAVDPLLTLFLQQAQAGGVGADRLADALAGSEPVHWLDAFQRLWVDLLLATQGQPPRYYPELGAPLQAVGRQTAPASAWAAWRWLQDQRVHWRTPFNARLLCERAAQTLLGAVQAPRR